MSTEQSKKLKLLKQLKTELPENYGLFTGLLYELMIGACTVEECKEVINLFFELVAPPELISECDFLSIFEYRKKYTQLFGQSIITLEMLSFIAVLIPEGANVLEVGAGLCLTAFLLQELFNLHIYVTDPCTSYESSTVPRENFYMDVEKLTAMEALDKYLFCSVLLMIWPPYKDPMAYKGLERFHGDMFILVGDETCMANDDFFDLLDKDWFLYAWCDIRNWPGVRANIQVFRRNGKKFV